MAEGGLLLRARQEKERRELKQDIKVAIGKHLLVEFREGGQCNFRGSNFIGDMTILPMNHHQPMYIFQ